MVEKNLNPCLSDPKATPQYCNYVNPDHTLGPGEIKFIILTISLVQMHMETQREKNGF